MTFVRRCLTIFAGYTAGAVAAFLVPAYLFFFGFPDPVSSADMPDAIRGVVLMMLLVGGGLLVPTALVIAICETFRIRNVFVYVALGAVLGVALTVFMTGLSDTGGLFNHPIAFGAGAVAGLIYWGIAGRTAGEWRAAATQAAVTQ